MYDEYHKYAPDILKDCLSDFDGYVDYCANEFGLTDIREVYNSVSEHPRHVDIAYSSLCDDVTGGELPIQATMNFEDVCYEKYLDDKLVCFKQYASIKDMLNELFTSNISPDFSYFISDAPQGKYTCQYDEELVGNLNKVLLRECYEELVDNLIFVDDGVPPHADTLISAIEHSPSEMISSVKAHIYQNDLWERKPLESVWENLLDKAYDPSLNDDLDKALSVHAEIKDFREVVREFAETGIIPDSFKNREDSERI